MEISLYSLKQAGIIILDDSGPTYFNQVGGSVCLQLSTEGYFVPIANDASLDQPEMALPGRLSSLTKDMSSLSMAVALELNRLLKEIASTDRYEVDLDKLDKSTEAWVYIKVHPQGHSSIYDAAKPFEAVLTWPNSA